MIAASSVTQGLRTLWNRLAWRRSRPSFESVLRRTLAEQQRQQPLPLPHSSRGARSVDVRL